MLADSNGMQNVYAPLPFTAHLIFCVLATLLYAVLFNRRGRKQYLILIIAIDMTLMTQFWTQDIVIFFIGFAELIMLTFAIVLSYRSGKEDKERERRRRVEADRKKYEREQAEKYPDKPVKLRPYSISRDDKKDIIDGAFDDEDDE